MNKSLLLLCSSLILQAFLTQNATASGCPLPELISPCTCYHIINDLRMNCRGAEITQEAIANAVQAIRGGLDPNDWFEWDGWFRINSTSMESLDLSPFFQIYIQKIQVQFNPNLTSITGPTEFTGRIGAQSFEVHDSPELDDAGLGNIFQYFNTTLLEEVHLQNNNLEGYYEDGIELIPGLNSANLIHIDLSGNRLTRIKPGSFKNMTRLDSLHLMYNLIDEILENTFELHENHSSRYYSIMLNGNRLRDEGLHTNIGVGNINVRGYFYFSRNQFETFSRETFEPLMTGEHFNTIRVYDNPIVCDERVKWLKDNRDKFGLWFVGGDCSNDPGFTVFTSTLIP